MPKYLVHIIHEFEDSIEVEADSVDEAMDLAEEEMRGNWLVKHSKDPYNAYTAWDNYQAYEVDEINE